MRSFVTKKEVALCLEALKTARCEIEAMEKSFPEYCVTGRLIDQLEAGEKLLEEEKRRLS